MQIVRRVGEVDSQELGWLTLTDEVTDWLNWLYVYD